LLNLFLLLEFLTHNTNWYGSLFPPQTKTLNR